jgi:hypothetical protein
MEGQEVKICYKFDRKRIQRRCLSFIVRILVETELFLGLFGRVSAGVAVSPFEIYIYGDSGDLSGNPVICRCARFAACNYRGDRYDSVNKSYLCRRRQGTPNEP